MSEVKNDNKPTELYPVCPFCGDDPARIMSRGPIAIKVFFVEIVYCGNPDCRKILGVHSVDEKYVRRSDRLVMPDLKM